MLTLHATHARIRVGSNIVLDGQSEPDSSQDNHCQQDKQHILDKEMLVAAGFQQLVHRTYINVVSFQAPVFLNRFDEVSIIPAHDVKVVIEELVCVAWHVLVQKWQMG